MTNDQKQPIRHNVRKQSKIPILSSDLSPIIFGNNRLIYWMRCMTEPQRLEFVRRRMALYHKEGFAAVKARQSRRSGEHPEETNLRPEYDDDYIEPKK